MKMLARIDHLIARKGMTQGELERLAGLAGNRISRWKGGMGEPTARQAARIAGILDVPVEWLIAEDGPVDSPPPGSASLSYDQKTVLAIVDALGLTLEDAIRRLNHPVPAPQPRAAGRKHESA